MLFLSLISSASAAIIVVTTTIEDAVNSAASGDTIVVPAGTYYNEDISVTKDLMIIGDGCGQTVVVGNSVNVFTVGASSLLLQDMTVTTQEIARGVEAVDSTVSLEQVCFEKLGDPNAVGGGVLAINSTIVIVESEMYANTALSGGAVFATDSKLFAKDTGFSFNMAGEYGGAFALKETPAEVSFNVFKYNEAGLDGGAVWAVGSELYQDTSSEYNDNEAINGGAILFESTQGDIDGSVFAENSATDNGGAIANITDAWDLVLSSVQLTDNQAGTEGGGVYMEDPSGNNPYLVIQDSVVVGNSASSAGGGVRIDQIGSVELLYNRFVQNTTSMVSPARGGALHASGIEDMRVENSFFCENESVHGGAANTLQLASMEHWVNNVFLNNTGDDAGLSTSHDTGATTMVQQNTFFAQSGTASTGIFASDLGSGGGMWEFVGNLFDSGTTGSALRGVSGISSLTNIDSQFWANTTDVDGVFYTSGDLGSSLLGSDPGLTLPSGCNVTPSDLEGADGYGADPYSVHF